MSAYELRQARLELKARLRSGEQVSAAEKKAIGYGGWGRYATTQAINVGGTRDAMVAKSMVAAGQESQAVGFLRGEGYSQKDVGTIISPPTFKVKQKEQKPFVASSSEYNPAFVPDAQRKSYYTPESDRIKTYLHHLENQLPAIPGLPQPYSLQPWHRVYHLH